MSQLPLFAHFVETTDKHARPPSNRVRLYMMPRLAKILSIVLLGLGLAGFGLRQYLTSRRVADQVVAQLQTVYKGDIKLGGVDVGLGSTSLTNLQLFEVGGDKTEPWLEVNELHTDFSLLDYFQGNSLPGKVQLSGAKVLLRFSREGKLLTTLPPDSMAGVNWETAHETGQYESVPVIDFEKSQVTIRTEGSPDLVFTNVAGKLDKNKNELVLAGAVDNAVWGRWTVTGLLHMQSAKISVQFKSQGSIHATQTMLSQIPFVPAACWQEVHVDQVDTPALVQVDYDLKQGETHCRAEFDPVGGQFRVHSMQLPVSNVRGKIIIEDNQVLLRNMRGDIFGGSVGLSADVNFQADSIGIVARIEASRLSVRQFPESWGLSPNADGKLTGVAALRIAITPAHVSAQNLAGMTALAESPFGPLGAAAGLLTIPLEPTIHTEGLGKGEIVDGATGSLRVRTLHVELHAVPGGFRFSY